MPGRRSKSKSVPETSDPEFYKKLIDGYDKRLGCYEKYPDIDLAGKSQVEEDRKSAIDSSGTYKDTYLASGGSYDYTTSSNHVNPTTGRPKPLPSLRLTERYFSWFNTGNTTCLFISYHAFFQIINILVNFVRLFSDFI